MSHQTQTADLPAALRANSKIYSNPKDLQNMPGLRTTTKPQFSYQM